jgi:uncharacterized membrane protein
LAIVNFPVEIAVVSLVVLRLSAHFGIWLGRKRGLQEAEREDFAVVQTATLTLLGLIIGFSFSMAMTRYDQRKNYEEAEANAIGTEYVRTELLPPADQATAKALLRKYLALRIDFYQRRAVDELSRINTETSRVQNQLWAAVREPAVAKPNVVVALAVAGMNDVLNSQGFTQAAWWNRIPAAAWIFMFLIAICANMMIGYGARNAASEPALLIVLPVIVSIAFLLIADIDSPGGGLIRIVPQNLVALSRSWPQ